MGLEGNAVNILAAVYHEVPNSNTRDGEFLKYLNSRPESFFPPFRGYLSIFRTGLRIPYGQSVPGCPAVT